MKRFLRFAATFALLAFVTVPLGACQTGGTDFFSKLGATISNVNTAYTAATTSTLPINQLVLARNAFNAAEVTATNFLRVKTCDGTNGPICRPAAATEKIASALLSGRAARNNLRAFMQQHPGQLGPKGLYDALTSATATIKAIRAQYPSAPQ